MKTRKTPGLIDEILLKPSEIAELIWLGMEAKGAVIPDGCEVDVTTSRPPSAPQTSAQRREAQMVARKTGRASQTNLYLVEIVVPFGEDAGSYVRVDMSKPETRHVGRGYAPVTDIFDDDDDDDPTEDL